MLPAISGEFGVVADPEIRVSEKGNAWAKIRCVAKDRVRDSMGNWSDGDPLFIDVVVSGQQAEHLVDSINKGDSILVNGKLRQRTWEKDGQKQSTVQIAADSVGVSVRWQAAKTQRVDNAGANVQYAIEALGAKVEAPF